MTINNKKISIEKGFKYFINFNAITGFFQRTIIPKTSGTPKINKTNLNNTNGSNSIAFKMVAVGSCRLLQNWKFKGVITKQTKVANAVRLTDKAEFPFAICVIKLEIFPPGQAATKNIPKAILGLGLIAFTNKKVSAGNNMNCEKIPVKSIFGFLNKRLKSSVVMPSATPNIIIANVMLSIQRPLLSKFITSESKS